MCISRIGESFDGLEPCHTKWITVARNLVNYRSRRGGVIIEGLTRNGGRSLVLRDGNPKQPDISIAKFGMETREVGGAHSTSDYRDNITLYRKGALL